MSHGSESTGEIIKSLVVNLVIAVAKFVAAGLTASGSMLAEALHSFADCGNQVLLLRGARASARPADDKHPLGYGRTMYFYSFIVALMLFFGGGVFAIYEGVHKFRHPEEVGDITVGVIILVVSIGLEGWSTLGNLKLMKKRRGATPFFKYLRETKDSDLIVVFGENSADVIGLVVAALAMTIAKVTGDGRWDAAGSIAIGLILVGIASFLAREVKSLLVGESADPEMLAQFNAVAEEDPDVVRVLRVLTIQQGPGEVVVAAKLELKPSLSTAGVVDAINRFERSLKARVPDVRWSFIEPDDHG